MEGADLECGKDLRAAQAGIALRQQVDVGCVAGADPAGAEARDDPALQMLPTVRSWCTLAMAGCRDRPSERAQDRLRGGEAGIEAVGGRYDDGGRLQGGKLRG